MGDLKLKLSESKMPIQTGQKYSVRIFRKSIGNEFVRARVWHVRIL